jgi:hypothetical protein
VLLGMNSDLTTGGSVVAGAIQWQECAELAMPPLYMRRLSQDTRQRYIAVLSRSSNLKRQVSVSRGFIAC